MECKYNADQINPERNIELIDTLWNVNEAGQKYRHFKIGELIDTLWNVNRHLRH